jgi:hypothetical protein
VIRITVGTSRVSAQLDGDWLHAPTLVRLLDILRRKGVADATAVRIGDGDSYVQYLSLSAAVKGHSAAPAREYRPRTGDMQTRNFEHLGSGR